MELGGHIIEDEPQDLVGEEGVSGGDLGPGIGPLVEPPRELLAAGDERVLEQLRRRRPVGSGQPLAERPPVDDLAPPRDQGEARTHAPVPAWSRFSR
jgi:hypothetical protein